MNIIFHEEKNQACLLEYMFKKAPIFDISFTELGNLTIAKYCYLIHIHHINYIFIIFMKGH